MSCNLCKTIWSSKEGYKNNFCNEWDEEISIVMEQKSHGYIFQLKWIVIIQTLIYKLTFAPNAERN